MNEINKQNGIILITAIFVVLLIATLGIGYLALVNNQLETANITLKSAKAFYCAETDIAKRVLELKKEGDLEPQRIESTGSWDGFQRIIGVDLVPNRKEEAGVVTTAIVQENWKEI